MSDAEKFNGAIHACALGCLDKEDFIDLTEYIETGGEFNWAELGEYQNLAALLPSFLQIEEPAAGVKNKVAKRLYNLKEEQKLAAAKAQSENKATASAASAIPKAAQAATGGAAAFEQVTPSSKRGSDSASGRPTQRTQIEMRGGEPGSDRPQGLPDQVNRSSVSPLNIPEPAELDMKGNTESVGGLTFDMGAIEEHIHEAELAGEMPQQNNDYQSEYIHNEPGAPVNNVPAQPFTPSLASENAPALDQPIIIKKGLPGWLFLLFVIVLIGGIYAVYYLLDAKITEVKNSIPAEVKKITSEYDAQLVQLNRQQQLLTLLGQSDTEFIKLNPGTGSTAYGKFIFSPSLRQGQLILSNLRIIPSQDQKVYQLWAKGVKSSIFVNIDISVSTTEYIPVSLNSNFTGEKSITILITREVVGTTPSAPSKEVELSGILKLR